MHTWDWVETLIERISNDVPDLDHELDLDPHQVCSRVLTQTKCVICRQKEVQIRNYWFRKSPIIYRGMFSILLQVRIWFTHQDHYHIQDRIRIKVQTRTVRPDSLDPFHVEGYYIKWVKTSWTYSIGILHKRIWFTTKQFKFSGNVFLFFLGSGSDPVFLSWWSDQDPKLCIQYSSKTKICIKETMSNSKPGRYPDRTKHSVK